MSHGLLERRRATVADAADPRVAARRAAVRRDRDRRWSRRALVVAIAATTVAAAYATAHSAALDVDRITVRGAGRTTEGEIREAAGIRVGDELVGVDIPGAEARVRALPWIDTATVTRLWSGAVGIDVTERRPAAVLRRDDGGTSTLVAADAEGRVLAPLADAGDLPVVVGATVPALGSSVDPAAGDLVAAAAATTPAVRSRVVAVRGGAGGVELDLRPAGVVRLGAPARLEQKMRSLETVFAQVDLRCLAAIDITVPDAPVLTRDPTCA